jgi:hypothetical protein
LNSHSIVAPQSDLHEKRFDESPLRLWFASMAYVLL